MVLVLIPKFFWHFATAFKCVKVITIYKKGYKSQLEYYRPISIISTLSKIFEILLNKQIINYFEENSLFSKCQFGFDLRVVLLN